MNPLSVVMLCFSMLGALDRIIGGKLGLADEFERGFKILGTMALTMIGMIVISPFIARILEPAFGFVYETLHVDPSIIPASLFANDMGGAPLSKEVALNADIGMFNALVVSSMMGCTVSYTIPYALGAVPKDKHRVLLLGLLCGLVTIPLGCFVAGLVLRLPIGALIVSLLPLVVFSGLIAVGLMLCPDVCVKIFNAFGVFIKIIITIGLALGILKYLAGIELIEGLETLEEGAMVCVNASAVMSGAFPLMAVVARILRKPMKKLGERLGMSEVSVMGFISSMATSVTTFEVYKDMDYKGALMNAAFAVSGAFTFAGHLAFTMAFDASYIPSVIIGKLTAGFLSILAAAVLYRRLAGKEEKANL